MGKKSLKKKYSITLALFPVLTLYGFKMLPFLTFADYLLLFFMIAEIITEGFRIRFNKDFVPLIIYLILQPVFLLLFSSVNLNPVDALGTSWRLAFYIFGISFLQKNLQKKKFIKSIRIVGLFSTIYGFFQFFFGTYLHISLSPYLPFFPVLRTGLKEQQDSWIAYNWTVRPRAWFSEPSTFAIYLLLALLIEMFVVHRDSRKKNLCLIYIFGIVISHSSTGTIGLFILIIAWMLLFPGDFLYKIPKKMIIGVLLLLPLVGLFLYKSGYINAFIGHTFADGRGLSSQSHFAYIASAFLEDTTLMQFFFGKSLQEVSTGYLPGWFGTYYCLGIVGVLLYIRLFYRICKRSSLKSRIIVLTFIGLNFGTEIMLGVFMLLYMSAAMLQEESYESNWN